MTSARIALGRAGGSIRTQDQLDFRLAHARARDAVLSPFDPEALAEEIRALGEAVLVVQSEARDRAEFLQRPDFGRRLAPESRALLAEQGGAASDLVIVISDGLSTLAASTQAVPVLKELLPLLRESGWTVAPIVVARQGRVALQDEVGEILRARVSLMLLGERPGLGSADSLGAYFTYEPGLGRTDANRNCLSNIRPGGLTAAQAAQKLHYLLGQALKLKLSGVELKDDAPMLGPADSSPKLQ